MTGIRAVTIKELRQIGRDRRTLLILLFVPAFFLLVYGYALNFDIRHIRLAVQDLDHSAESRALVSAFYMLTINLIGAALGPTAIALCTDYWFADPAELPLAIAAVCAIASPLALVFLLIGLRGYIKALSEPANDADAL